jgi:hypothetical protein
MSKKTMKSHCLSFPALAISSVRFAGNLDYISKRNTSSLFLVTYTVPIEIKGVSFCFPKHYVRRWDIRYIYLFEVSIIDSNDNDMVKNKTYFECTNPNKRLPRYEIKEAQ